MVETKPRTDPEARPAHHRPPKQQDNQPPVSAAQRRKLSTRARGLLVLIVLAVIATAITYLLFHRTGAPNSVVALSGRIEGDDSAVAPKIAGRILEIH
jgi:multidrug resistance efflux pump